MCTRHSQLSIFFYAIFWVIFINFCLFSFSYAATPANPNANSQVKAILNFLESLPEKSQKKVISGQYVHDARMNNKQFVEYVEDLASKTGEYVGMIESSYGTINTSEIKNISVVNLILSDFWEKGGLVMLHAPIANPVTEGNIWDKAKVALKDLYTPGNAAYKKFHSDLDKFAVGIKELESKGVVVLFRPFGEMNGSWFWWGADQNRNEYIEFWRHVFDYFTYTHQLNNILWVYAPTIPSEWGKSVLDRYPGNNYVDIVGVSYYYCNLERKTFYDDLLKLGKPIALTEVGPKKSCIPFDNKKTIELIKKNYPKITFFNQWRASQSIIYNNNAKEFLQDPWIINRDDLSILRREPLKPEGAKITISRSISSN